MNQGVCTHSEDERCLVGTWVVDEVCKAMEMGYSLVDVFEFWEYNVRSITMKPIQAVCSHSISICS